MLESEISKYRIDSARLKNWDYSSSGYYFITICTKNMKCFFGWIKNEDFNFSDAGKILKHEWLKTFDIRDNVSIDEWRVMPNHFHAIIVINAQKYSNDTNKNMKSNSLSSIINQFKGNCTRKIRGIGLKEFQWQSRYHDHIIRDEDSLLKIRNYIKYNHLKWQEDKYYQQ